MLLFPSNGTLVIKNCGVDENLLTLKDIDSTLNKKEHYKSNLNNVIAFQ